MISFSFNILDIHNKTTIFNKEYKSSFKISAIPIILITYLVEYLNHVEFGLKFFLWIPLLIIFIATILGIIITIFFGKKINKALMKRNFKKAIREYPNDKEELTKLMNEYLEAYGNVQLPINSEKEIK